MENSLWDLGKGVEPLTRFDLTGKTAIVTGAGRGIGKALALGLAEAGAQVAAVARTQADLQETVQAIEAKGGVAYPITAGCSATECSAKKRGIPCGECLSIGGD